MDGLILLKKQELQLAKKYSKGKVGRKPYPLSVMLRVHVMQLLYNLSDPAMEDALYEIESMRRFAGLRLSDNLPDETTILNFRHFLERHKFGQRLFDTIQSHLASQGLKLQEGSIVDATMIGSLLSDLVSERNWPSPIHWLPRKNQRPVLGRKWNIAFIGPSVNLVTVKCDTEAWKDYQSTLPVSRFYQSASGRAIYCDLTG